VSADRYLELADRLEAIGEEIADLALDEIRLAMRAGAIRRPDSERQLTQARRAVDKAVHGLRRLADAAEADAAESDVTE
jgi:hypothetical protein